LNLSLNDYHEIKKNLKNPEKAHTYVSALIEGFNLEARFLICNLGIIKNKNFTGKIYV
jgi:hypothetical protein